MIVAFCVGWVSALCFVWVLLNKFDYSGNFASILGNQTVLHKGDTIQSSALDVQLQQLSSLIKDNTELLHLIRETKRPIPQKYTTSHFNSQEEDKLSFYERRERSPDDSLTARTKSESVTPVHKEGYLFSQDSSKLWKKYYLVLTTSQISLYKVPDGPCIAHIKLGSISVDQTAPKYSFVLQADSPIVEPESESMGLDEKAHEILFRSKDEAQITEWTESIQNCINMTHQLNGEDDFMDEFFGLDDDTDDFEEFSNHEEIQEVDEKKMELGEIQIQDYLSVTSSPQVKQLLTSMVKSLGSYFDPYNHDGATLLRYLRARGMEPQKAAAMMKARIDWENKVHPTDITLEDIQSEAVKKKAYFHCFDRKRRPCIIVLASAHVPKDSSVQVMLKLVIFLLENAIKNAPVGIENFTAIFDCTGFAVGQMDWPLVKESIATLQNYYPERLGALYIVNYPFVINMVWKMIKPWLDARTTDKIQFIDTKKLREYIEPRFLPVRFGGTSLFETYDFLLGLETLEEAYVPPQKQ